MTIFLIILASIIWLIDFLVLLDAKFDYKNRFLCISVRTKKEQ
ncbi:MULTISPECIES: hypothetical protein [Thermoanaerobacterium]|uniref:Uncharacterized protein n=1 Tax=Thermoanaerobacterium butyriciformans TaxID=1702242 RepID=A0ABS4NB58_9THEO|nr:hypothetical protein [Thermoanaerobacterium butyriciformans]MBP2070920.1 hypothetical protein [Thermoanaerobacterium butyriciformans]WHE06946.1 hypothetical protein PGH24_12550 [Thermoanaerobacterium thermosaccharolyticum]